VRLLKNRILVRLLSGEQKSIGGIIIPETVGEKCNPTVKAEVILLGEKSQYGEWWLKVGDIVNMDNPKLAKSPMQEVEYEWQDCLIVNENDVNFVL
jgi:chaperonin GroES